jgi:hypothetical protein
LRRLNAKPVKSQKGKVRGPAYCFDSEIS